MKIRFRSFCFLIGILFFSACSKGGTKDALKAESIKRVVSLGPSATEILFAIGAEKQIAARTDLCDFPPEAETIASVGGFAGNTISLETILSFEPDLVYLYQGIHDVFVKPLEDAGIRVYISNASSIEDVKKEVLDMGELTGHKKEAQKVVSKMNETLERVSKKIKKHLREKNHSAGEFTDASDDAGGQNKTSGEFTDAPTVYWEIWPSPMMTVGKDSFINDIIKAAGGKNIFEDELSAYPIVTAEAVIFAHPDFIFYTGDGTEKGAVWNPEKQMTAAKGIYYVGDDNRFVRSSPRCVDAVEKLADILWK